MIANPAVTTRRRPLALAIATALGLLAAGCAPAPGPSGAATPPPAPVSPAPLIAAPAPPPAPAAVVTPPASPADQQLRDLVANTSLRGTNPAGDDYCTYYGADGTMTTILRGSSPEAGAWTASDGALCERRGVGATICSRLAVQPTTQTATLTTLDGGRQTTATVTRGNTCTAF
ncbi:MAG: hypothetical protein ACFCVH_02885 [Alphaproteobacteria bacterium]